MTIQEKIALNQKLAEQQAIDTLSQITYGQTLKSDYGDSSGQQIAQGKVNNAYQGGLGYNKRQSISQRIDYQLQDANFHADKIEKLRELSNLLAEFPHVARILDLIEEVG